jgi:hypothetical protein
VYEVALIVLCACPSGKSEHLQTLAELQSLLDGTMTVDFAVAAEERASSAAPCAASLMGRLERAQLKESAARLATRHADA